jgi:hypothetical protein
MTSPRAPVGPVHLDHDQALIAQPTPQPRTPAARAFRADPVDDPEPARPREQLAEARHRGRGTQRAKLTTEMIQRRRYMNLGVGIDAQRDEQLGLWHGEHCRLLSPQRVMAPTGR